MLYGYAITVLDWLLNLDIAHELIVLVIGALPVSELRGAIPVGINIFHMPWHKVFLLAVIGNTIPVPIILKGFDYLAKLISLAGPGKRFIEWLLTHTRKQSMRIRKYERIGLILFVAIPLPITGAWTASIAAFLMGLRFWYAFFAIFCGIIIAATIVTCLSLLGWIGALIAGIGLALVAIAGWWRI